MDSTEINKISAAVISALLLFLLLHFFSGKIYGTRETHGDDHDQVLAFAIEIEQAEDTAAEEPEEVDYSILLASADVASGEKLFKKCKACHKLDEGAHGVGPSLHGVVGRGVGGIDGFGYSGAMANFGGDWTLAQLGDFLEKPSNYIPGTKMVFKGFKDPQDRVDLIVYLNEADGSPEALE
ncbi:MAG: c-type cytochrome [Pseudomonadota bacterium]